MAGKFKILEIKDLLYGSKQPIDVFGLNAGNRSAANVGLSRLHTGRTKTATVSNVGRAVDKLINGDISISHVRGQEMSYVEVKHRNVLSQMLIKCTPDGFEAVTDKEPGSDTAYLLAAFSAFALNREMIRLKKDKDAYEAEINAPLISFLGFAKNGKNLSSYFLSGEQEKLFCMCDCFYFGIGKSGKIMVKEDADVFHAQMDRIMQASALEHDELTAPVKLIQENKVKSSADPDQPEMFTEPLDKFFGRCKAGEFLIDYPWNDTQKKYVVPLSFLDTFIPTEAFRLLLLSVWSQVKENLRQMKEGVPYDQIMAKDPINIKLIGKPGSGKTTVIEAVLACMGYPKGMINCKGHMEEDEIEGMNKFVNGSIYSIPTKAGELHSVGGAVILEEFNLPDPDILMGSLGQALAYPFILKVDGYREYKRHPLTIYIATMNVGTEGSKPVNEALSSRFPEGHILEEVAEDEFVTILSSAGYKKKDCRMVYKAYRGIINYLGKNREDLALSVTLRHCQSALKKMRIGFTRQQAYEATFISQLYSSDPEVAENVRSDVLKAVA